RTAAVTAPPDLWLMRQILARHAKTGLLSRLQSGSHVVVDPSADPSLRFDLQFLSTRGILCYANQNGTRFYYKSFSCPYPLGPDFRLPSKFQTDITDILCQGFGGDLPENKEALIGEWLELPFVSQETSGWIASQSDLEIGYRLLPVILGLHA